MKNKEIIWWLLALAFVLIFYLIFHQNKTVTSQQVSTDQACDPNSYIMPDGKCYCKAGYVLNDDKSACISSSDEETIILNRLNAIVKTAK